MVCSPVIISANNNCVAIQLNTVTVMAHTVVRTDFFWRPV